MGELIEETKLTPKELAEALGMTHQWVLKYLPDTYKQEDKQRAGLISAEHRVKQRLTEQGASLAPQEEEPAEEEEPEATEEKPAVAPTTAILEAKIAGALLEPDINKMLGQPLDKIKKLIASKGLDPDKFLAEYKEKYKYLWNKFYGEPKKPSLEQEAEKLGITLPQATVPRQTTILCPPCWNRVSTDALDLVYKDFKYAQPNLTVVQLLELIEKTRK